MTGSTPPDDAAELVTIDDCYDLSSQTSNCLLRHEILQAGIFPLSSEGNQLPYEFADDPWSILVNDKVIGELTSERKSVVIIIKHLQREFSTVTADTIDWHLNVQYYLLEMLYGFSAFPDNIFLFIGHCGYYQSFLHDMERYCRVE